MDIKKAWKQADRESPAVNYAFDPQTGELFVVVEDNSTIYRIVNNTGTIYVVAGFRCSRASDPDFLNGTAYYNIDDPVLHVVLCSTVSSNRDQFAINLAKEYLTVDR